MADDPTIKIQALEKEYNVILKQYEEAYKNYINDLSESDFSSTDGNKYQLLLLNGISDNTACSSETNMPDNIGVYSKEECETGCDQDPECSGYQLTNKDVNDNYNCEIFKNEAVSVVNSDGGNGCYAKIDSPYYTAPTTNSKSNSSSTKFATLKGRSYWGTSGLSEGVAQTVEECESMCASDTKCTGATFNPVKRYCWTRTGNGNITTGTDNEYAIIPILRQNMIILQNLNTRLIDVNNQLSAELHKIYPIAKEDVTKTNEKQQELANYYGNLLKEQKMIEKMIQEYMTLQEEYDNQSLYVNQQNMIFKMWLLFALFILAITLINMFNIPMGSISFVFIIIGVAIIFSFNY